MRCGRPACTNEFYRRDTEVGRVEMCYCSRSCAAIINNQIQPKRIGQKHPCGNRTCRTLVPKSAVYCSRKCRWIDTTEFSDAALKVLILDTSKRLGRTPTKRELGRIADMCIRAFGSWNSAIIQVGLTPYRSHSERMYRRSRTVASDGHKCDSVSEALIDNWLTDHGIPHERDARYPDTKHRADWLIDGRVFIEYFGLAKDSRRYDRSIAKKKLLCKRHGIPLIEVYPDDLYPKVRLSEKIQ